MSFITDPKSASFSLWKTDTDASNATVLGTKFHTEDGRELTLVKAGSVNLASGVLVQNSAIVAAHQNMATSTAAAGATSLTVTLGAGALAANYYAGGYVVVNAGAGIGQTLRIASHPSSAGSTTLVLTLEDSIVTATNSASTKTCLIAAPGNGVVINPTTATASPVGVTLYPIAASSYGYVVNKGVVSCLSDVNVAGVGLGIMPSTTTAGAITVIAATGNNIGSAYQTSVSAEARAIQIML